MCALRKCRRGGSGPRGTPLDDIDFVTPDQSRGEGEGVHRVNKIYLGPGMGRNSNIFFHTNGVKGILEVQLQKYFCWSLILLRALLHVP